MHVYTSIPHHQLMRALDFYAHAALEVYMDMAAVFVQFPGSTRLPTQDGEPKGPITWTYSQCCPSVALHGCPVAPVT